MNKILSAVAFLACASTLSACGAESPIAETAEAAPPVVETRPGVGHIYGRWAQDAGSCTSRAVTIGEQRLETTERTCTMTTPERNGEGWLVTLECSGANGAASVTERVRFVPEEEKLTLNFIDRAERNDERLTRCAG